MSTIDLVALFDLVEADEAAQPERDAMLENLYAALDDPRLADSFGSVFIEQGIDSLILLCGCAAARAALLDYHLGEYQRRLEEAMASPDRTFGAA